MRTQRNGWSDLQPYRGIGFIGRLKNGQVSGHFWVGMIGGGFLHGLANSDGLASGSDVAYIYPDGETAFRGHFENRAMMKVSWFCL